MSKSHISSLSRPWTNNLAAPAAVLALMVTPISVRAADVYWNPGGAGAGTWDTSAANWNPASDGSGINAAWTNGDNAVFSAGAGYTTQFNVTAGPVTVGNITVEEGRVQTNVGNTITLNSGVNTYTVARSSGDYDLRINNVLAGTGSIVKEGAGMLMLTGNNTFSGGFTLNNGTANFESSSTAFGSGTLTLNGGNLAKTWGSGVTFANAVNVTGTTNVGIVQGSASDIILTGAFTGTGTFSVGNTSINGFAVQAASVKVTGDLSGFTGTFQQNTIASGSSNRLRFGPTSTGSTTVNISSGKINMTGATSTTSQSVIDLGDGVYGTVKVGELSGTGGVLRGGWGTNTVGVGGTTTFEVGALNTSSAFAGSLQDNLGSNGNGKSALTKVGSGTLTLSGSNSYTGATTLNAGTLALGASDRISNSSAMVLNGGTFATGGFSETLSTLTLSSTSTIDFGLGTSALVFADSSAITWAGTLNLLNFNVGTDSLKFGASSTALTASQLSAISLSGYAASLDGSGFVTFTAVPEPHEFALMIVGLLGVTIFIRRRNQQA